MISFTTSQKLSTYLIITKLYPLEKTAGSKKSKKKRCEFVKILKIEIPFESSVTSQTFIINHQLTYFN